MQNIVFLLVLITWSYSNETTSRLFKFNLPFESFANQSNKAVFARVVYGNFVNATVVVHCFNEN